MGGAGCGEYIHFCFTDYVKAFDCVVPNLWKVHTEMGIPDNLTYLLRNLCAGQEATVKTIHRLVPDWETGLTRLYVVTLLI